MKKKVLPLVLTAAMALCAVPAMADDAVEVMSTTQAVTVNGEKVDFEGFNIEGFNYFKLEDVAAAVDKNVTFDGKTFTIEEAPAEETTEATAETTAEAPAEEETAVEEGTEGTTDVEYSSIEVEGVEYFKLRDLADIIGFGVDYDAATSTVVITTEAE